MSLTSWRPSCRTTDTATRRRCARSRIRPWQYVARPYSTGGSEEGPEPAEWQDTGFTLRSVSWLRPEELSELNEQLKPLFMAHLDRVLDPAKRPADGRLTRLFAWAATARSLQRGRSG